MHAIPTWATYSLLSLYYAPPLFVVWRSMRNKQTFKLTAAKGWLFALYALVSAFLLTYTMVSAKDPLMVMTLMTIPAVIGAVLIVRLLGREVSRQVLEDQHR